MVFRERSSFIYKLFNRQKPGFGWIYDWTVDLLQPLQWHRGTDADIGIVRRLGAGMPWICGSCVVPAWFGMVYSWAHHTLW